MSDTSTREKQLIKDFLEFGTANGFGDLSMLVPWLFKAEKASHSHLIEEVEQLKQAYLKKTTGDTQWGAGNRVGYKDAILDVISLLKRKGETE